MIAYPAHLALFFSLGLPLSRIDDKNHINQLSSFKSKQVLSMFDFVSSLWGGATSRRIPSLTYISLEQVGWGPRRLSWSSWSSWSSGQTGQQGHTAQTGQTSQKEQTGQTDLTFKLDFPGNLCRAAMFYKEIYAISAISSISQSHMTALIPDNCHFFNTDTIFGA